MKFVYNFFIFLFFLRIHALSLQTTDLFEFDCPPYRVTGDSKATPGIAITCRIWACPGQTIEATQCDADDQFGDNFLRLYEEGVERVFNDDYWSVLRLCSYIHSFIASVYVAQLYY